MAKTLHRLYLRFRSPRTFLIALSTFIVVAMFLHYTRGYDSDWGGTNLTLSIEASVASAVINVGLQEILDIVRVVLGVVQKIEQISIEHRQILGVLQSLAERQDKTLQGVLLIAEAQRDALLALQEKPHGTQRSKRKSAIQSDGASVHGAK